VRYEQYCQTKNPDSLNELVAILYRRKRLFWFINRHFTESPDPRVRFWDRTLLARTRHIASIPDETKYAIFLFFSGVMGSLPATFPNVYKPKPSSKTTGQNSWSTLIISLADGKTDDESLNRIMNSNLYNVFLGMEQKSIEYFEFLKKHPAND
jgi:hypothetical protein